MDCHEVAQSTDGPLRPPDQMLRCGGEALTRRAPVVNPSGDELLVNPAPRSRLPEAGLRGALT